MQVGSITVLAAGTHAVLPNDLIVIARGIPINQPQSFISTGSLSIVLLEQALDRQATISQEIYNAEILNPTPTPTPTATPTPTPNGSHPHAVSNPHPKPDPDAEPHSNAFAHADPITYANGDAHSTATPTPSPTPTPSLHATVSPTNIFGSGVNSADDGVHDLHGHGRLGGYLRTYVSGQHMSINTGLAATTTVTFGGSAGVYTMVMDCVVTDSAMNTTTTSNVTVQITLR